MTYQKLLKIQHNVNTISKVIGLKIFSTKMCT